MATEFCPQCHQPMAETFAGIRLPVFKAALCRFIKSHPGQTSLEMAGHFYGSVTPRNAATIRTHIYQLNEALAAVDLHIHGGRWQGYTIGRSS